MTRYTLSIQSLYETFGEKLTYGYITTEQDDRGGFYYDFHNRYGKLACCDGETVEILGKENGVYTLLSDCSLEEDTFCLTEDELNYAVINSETHCELNELIKEGIS